MDLSGIEECPIDIQIGGGAREINEITPPTPPRFLNFLFMVRFSCNKLEQRATTNALRRSYARMTPKASSCLVLIYGRNYTTFE